MLCATGARLVTPARVLAYCLRTDRHYHYGGGGGSADAMAHRGVRAAIARYAAPPAAYAAVCGVDAARRVVTVRARLGVSARPAGDVRLQRPVT